MKDKYVKVELAVDMKGDSLIANMIFVNNSDRDIVWMVKQYVLIIKPGVMFLR
jgi:hypothetical protein